jgi:hypothetical protein
MGHRSEALKLWYDRAKKRFYLLVRLAIDTPDPTPAALAEVIGIDLGQRYLAVLTTPENHTQFYSRRAGESESRPLRSSAETAGAARHSLGYAATHRHRSGRRDGSS